MKQYFIQFQLNFRGLSNIYFAQKHRYWKQIFLFLTGLLIGQMALAQTGPNDDFDGDGIINSIDIDDDNDGVLDKIENRCPSLATWTDWTSVAANTSATGTLGLSSGSVIVTYSSSQVYSIQSPGYFNLGDAYGGSMPSSGVEGLQALHGANVTHTYTFSQPVKDPILVFWSMNGNTFTFSNPFTILGQQNGVTRTATTLIGVSGECNATIQLHGTYTSISYKSSLLENWTGVTVGVQQCANTLDSDNDGIVNSFDLDSDNDGCSDAFEAGATKNKTANFQFTGVVGTNGLVNTIETGVDYGVVNYTSSYGFAISSTQNLCIDTDNDGISDIIDIDDDNDGVPDKIEFSCPTYATWTDWTSVSAYTSATGTLGLSSGNVTVTYTSPQVISIQQPGYFNLGDAYDGIMPTSGTEGLQAHHGAGLTHTYTFSQPVKNPILVFWSMNSNTFSFSDPFTLVAQKGGAAVSGASLVGAAGECNAAIQFYGTYTSISYTSSILEGWTGVTVGVQQCNYTLDSDNDNVVNSLDLDSDNDGCSDAFEGGATSDRLTPNFKFGGTVGTNGLVDSLETATDNSVIRYTSKYKTFANDNGNIRCDLKAPGGVFTDLEFWYKPEDGVTLNSGKVSSWVDQTNGIEVTPAAAANGPTYYDSGTNLINFNPTLNFTNATRQDGLRANTGLSALSTGVSTFSVMMPTDAAARWFLQWGVSGAGYYANYGACSANNPGVWTNSHGGCVNIATALGPIVTPSFVSSRWNSTAGTNQWQLRRNGQLHSGTTSSTTMNVTANTALEIGDVNNRSAGNEYVGNISEVIGYTSRLGDVDRQKVESYISIKYGITYMNDANSNARNYLSAAGTTIWDTTTNAGYNNNVFAIGRDDVSGLSQKQSKSVNTGVQPIFALGNIVTNNQANTSSFAANTSFLFAGSNTGTTRFFTAITAPVGNNTNYRFNRIWKVQETGTVGTVQFAIPNYISAGNTIYLVRSTDATFDATDSWIPLSTTVTVNGVAYAAGNIDFNNGDFFTVATYVGAPGCVAGNLNYWLKADAIGDDDASSLAEWKNQALLGLDSVGQAATGSRPTFYNTTESNLVNFNPSVSFDGGDELTQNARMFANTSAFTQIALAVDRRTNAGELRAPLGGGFGSGDFIGLDFQTDGVSPNGWNPYSGIDAEWGNTTANYRLYSLGLGATNQSGNIVGVTTNNVSGGSDNVISYVNGAKDLTTISANQNSLFGNGMYVGSSGGQQWLGLVPEVIVYDKQLSDAEIQRVYSYLAIKYGVTLRQPYVNSAGTTIFDTTGYANNIAGIGREACQSLNQKQSRSMIAGFQPTIGLTTIETTNASNGAALADGSFMIWGSDNGIASFATNIAPPAGVSANNRFTRIWKVQETGTVGTVKFAVPSSVSLEGTVYLIRSTNTTFDATDTWLPLSTLTVGGTEYLAADIDFANGDYFTIATYVTAPGCVAGLKTWVKADAGISVADGGSVSTWSDASGNDYHLTQPTAGNQPKYYNTTASKLINFNPTLDFNGSQFIGNRTRIMPNTSQYTFLGVGIDEDNGTGYRGLFSSQTNVDYLILYKQGGATGNNGWRPYSVGNIDMGKGTKYSPTATGSNGYWNGTNYSQDASVYKTQPTIAGFSSKNSLSTDPFNTWVDGWKDNPTTKPTVQRTQYFGAFGVGADYDMNGSGPEAWLGRIPEVVAYDRELTDAEMQKVNTYFAIKYGITLGQGNGHVGLNGNNYNYVSSTGKVIWDATANSTYKYNIAGIGYEKCQGLNQKQSQSVQAGFQPIIGLGGVQTTNAANTAIFAADSSFLIWGNDAGAASFATAITAPSGASANNRFTRVWKVQETGTVGSVKVAVPGTLGGGNTVYLLRSTDATFDATDTWTPLSIYAVNGTNYLAADIDFNNGDYFTIATYVSAPGCVVSGLQVWLKADAGTSSTTDGAALTSWIDQSVNGRDHTQTNTTYQPKYKANSGFNYQPSVTFDGNNTLVADAFASGNEAVHVFAMAKVGDGGWRSIYGFGRDATHVQWLSDNANRKPSVWLSGNNYPATNLALDYGVTSYILPKDGSQKTIYWNGTAGNITGINTYTFNTNKMGVGSDVDNTGTSLSENFLGDINEVVIYKTGTPTTNGGLMPLTDIQKIESYLGLKYGVTLSHNYFSGSGKTIYDRSTFGNNIFGIGREVCQGLNTKQSRSVTSNKLTIGLADSIAIDNATHPASFSQDSSFILIGDNGLTGVVTPSVSGACPLPPSADKASAQKFKVVETGSVQSIRLNFSTSGLGYNSSYPVYMQVASDSNFANLIVTVPMLWSGSNVYANYDFPANATSYIRFVGNTTSLANICTAATTQTFHFNKWTYGTKTQDIIANYGTSANAGDMVMKATVTDGTPNVLLYRPTVDWWPVWDGYGLFIPRWGSTANQNSTITTKLQFLSQATTGAANASATKLAAQTVSFTVWDLDGYIGSRDVVKVYGKLGTAIIDPKITLNKYTACTTNYGGDPQSVIGGTLPWDGSVWGQAYVTFDSPVEEVYVEYKQTATYAFNSYQDVRITDITATCKPPTPKVVTPDNVYIFKEVASPVKSGDRAKYKFTILNNNCGDQTISFSDILPNGSGLTWVDSTLSTPLSIGTTNAYGGTRTLTLNNVTVPAGTSYLYVDALTSTAGTYNNQATYVVNGNLYVSENNATTTPNDPTPITVIANDPEANLTITKSVDNATAQRDSILTYTYTITNPNGSAINTTFQDQLPADAAGVTPTYVASSLTGVGAALVSTYAGTASLTIRNLSVPANGSLTVTIKANIGQYTIGDTIKNVASIVPDVAAGYRLTTKYSGSANTKVIGITGATYTFNCGTSSTTGTFIANGTAAQAGTLTIGLTSATAGTATFTVTGTGFTGSLSTTLTAGQTSVTIPITYDGTGTSGSRTLTVTGTGSTGTCTPSVSVICGAGATAPNLASTTISNVCPIVNANLSSIAVGNKPSGSVMTWHTGTPATSANKVPDSTSVAAGTYYAAFYNVAQACYGGTTAGDATTAVTVTLTVCPADITVSNVCPATTVDLTTRFSGTIPSGKVVTWHTGLPTTTANKVANPAAVGAGTYYAAFYDSVNDCYSPGSPNGIVVNITTCVTCVAGSVAPSVPATKTNACPLTTVDLSSVTATNQPANTTLSWHTGTPANSTNILTGTTSVGVGTYYAAFYDAAANCFSTATTAVTVTITTCVTCEAGYSKPTLSATTKSNTCPTTTANLGTITASYLPVGTTLSWHSATPATLANKVPDSSAVAAGTYYAAFYDKVNGCFSGGGDSTTAVVVTINSCASPDLITTIGQPTPALVAGQSSNLPVKVTNIGGVTATGPITTTITLPTGVSAPATFTTNGSTCATVTQTVTCTNTGSIAANDSIVMNIPITPNASIVGTNPTFNATVAPVAGETNTSNNVATPTSTTAAVAAATVKVSAKAFLSGAYVSVAGMMHDSLRVKGLIPSAQPYSAAPFSYSGTETIAPSVLTVTGANAIVDWVLVELRSNATTVVTKRAGLIQRDGDIVDTDGVTPLAFTAASGSYYIVIRHRNHLGVMTANTVALTSTTTTVDFTSTSTANYQRTDAFANVNAQRTFGTVRALWGGNANGNGNVIATGASSDGSAVNLKVLLDNGNSALVSPSFIIYNVYHREDANMDGKTIYQGTGNEVSAILLNVLNHPSNTGVVATYIIYEQLP